MTAPTPFTIDIDPGTVTDLHRRLVATRWPDHVADDWSRGTAPSTLRRVLDHWRDTYDWSTVQRSLNEQEHVRVQVDGVGLHARLAGATDRPPLLLVHGWPDSFLRFEDVVPLLADEFCLIMPSIPGYGFSDVPTAPGCGPERVADLFAGLMTALGHDRFGVHGGDLGSIVGEQLAFRHGDRVTGLHLTDLPYWHLFTLDQDTLSEPERAFLERGMRWNRQEGAYAALQGTKPQTLAASLADSPAGLASWFLEKYQAWCDGDAVDVFGLDRLATNATLYWVTNTAGSAARYYFETMSTRFAGPTQQLGIPAAVALFPADIEAAPREFAERFFDVVRWTEMPRGGHFAAWEEPQLLADDLREFFTDRR